MGLLQVVYTFLGKEEKVFKLLGDVKVKARYAGMFDVPPSAQVSEEFANLSVRGQREKAHAAWGAYNWARSVQSLRRWFVRWKRLTIFPACMPCTFTRPRSSTLRTSLRLQVIATHPQQKRGLHRRWSRTFRVPLQLCVVFGR